MVAPSEGLLVLGLVLTLAPFALVGLVAFLAPLLAPLLLVLRPVYVLARNTACAATLRRAATRVPRWPRGASRLQIFVCAAIGVVLFIAGVALTPSRAVAPHAGIPIGYRHLSRSPPRGEDARADESVAGMAGGDGTSKVVLATLTRVDGRDFACADADGPDRHACQIRCTAPCLEPYRLCLAYAMCAALAVNSDESFVTLKTALPPATRARPCASKRQWRAFLRETAARLHSAAGRGVPRSITLAVGAVRAHDMACIETDGSEADACQVACRHTPNCVGAYDACIAHSSCGLVVLDDDLDWATLKTDAALAAIGAAPRMAVPDRAAWHTAVRTARNASGARGPPRRLNGSAHRPILTSPTWASMYAKLADDLMRSGATGAHHHVPYGAPFKPIHLVIGHVAARFDYPCHASEGAAHACTMRCDAGCSSAYTECLSDARCHAIALDAARRHATLKTGFGDARGALPIASAVEWARHAMADPAARRAAWAHRRWGAGGPAGFHAHLLKLRGGGGLLVPPLGTFHDNALEHTLSDAAKREAFAQLGHLADLKQAVGIVTTAGHASRAGDGQQHRGAGGRRRNTTTARTTAAVRSGAAS